MKDANDIKKQMAQYYAIYDGRLDHLIDYNNLTDQELRDYNHPYVWPMLTIGDIKMQLIFDWQADRGIWDDDRWCTWKSLVQLGTQAFYEDKHFE